MLKRRQRLSRREFDHLLRRGVRVHGTDVTVVWMDATELKCGVVVSKKVARHATERNRLRRLVYKVLGDSLPNIAKRHLAVLLRPGVLRVSSADLVVVLQNTLEKLPLR